MATARGFTVQVNLPKEIPDGIKPTLYVFDAHGRPVTVASVPRTGTVGVNIPSSLKGSALRYAIAPIEEKETDLKQLRRVNAVERILPFDPEERPVIDIADGILQGWILCICTVRGRVVKSVPQPTGGSVDYPVCNARVHICEVDRFPRIVFRIPDHIIERVRDELLIDPPFPPDPIGPVARRIPRPPIEATPIPLPRPNPPINRRLARTGGANAAAGEMNVSALEMKTSAPVEMMNLARAESATEIRKVLIDLAILHPWWCWFPWLDPFFRYEVDCLWQTWTDSNGNFSKTFIYPCSDKPDIYIWVEQFIAGSWKTIYAKGPRCDTRWNYDCGTEITIHVTHPDAIVCVPPPEVVVPDDITTWVLPMAVGHFEIAGKGAHPGELGWLQPDGTVAYSGGPSNIDPVTDAPMGGYLRFKMLHSLDLPKSGMTRYVWSYRPKPAPDPTVTGDFFDPSLPNAHPANANAWVKLKEPISRHYQIPGPGGTPRFPVVGLGPDPDELFAFRPQTPPSGVWPVTGFWEDLWSAKLDSNAMDPGLYQIRLTVHDAAGNIVPPAAGTFRFVATDTRVAGETYDTRAASGSELIDGGFVFDVRIDNGHCTAGFDPVQTDSGATADACGFLRYANKATTMVTLAFEASHPRDQAWFQLELRRGMNDLDQVEVMNGAATGAVSAPVDSNGVSTWPNAAYGGDGAGNFSGTFSAGRFLETCDNGAFAANLWVRAKAHDGLSRLSGYDRRDTMAFALAEQTATP